MQDACQGGADAVECRLDYLASPPDEAQLQRLLHQTPLETIVTYRPTRQGGRFAGDEQRRLDVLRQAAAQAPAFIDIERGTPPGHWPPGSIILSHHDFSGRPDDLPALARELDDSPAAVNKIVFMAQGPEDALAALDLPRLCRKPTIALAMGESGVISRLLAGRVGAFGTFAALLNGAESAPGQPTLKEFRSLYRWDRVGPATAVYGVIGCPVGHSMSPAIPNAAFDAVGHDGVNVPVLIRPGAEHFDRFMDELLRRPWLNWRGLSVTIPHKENALRYVGADRCDELARKIGAVNTITIGPGGELRGDNTDYAAAIDSLCDAMRIARPGLARHSVAVLGAGGAARSIVAALRHYGAAVTIYNRTLDRAKSLAEEFACRAQPLGAAPDLRESIVINCTSVGMHPRVDECPLERIPPSVKVVFDTIYNPLRTRLLESAHLAGCLCVSGLEMFVNQAVAQFQTWTSLPAPRDVMRDVVLKRLRPEDNRS